MNNLTLNIMKLANELRKKGFAKHADELESNFLTVKQAETTLYNVFKETGEDLVDMAHPDGGVEMEKAKEDGGVVETIVEQKEKIKQVVDAMPTGKLAASQLVKIIKNFS